AGGTVTDPAGCKELRSPRSRASGNRASLAGLLNATCLRVSDVKVRDATCKGLFICISILSRYSQRRASTNHTARLNVAIRLSTANAGSSNRSCPANKVQWTGIGRAPRGGGTRGPGPTAGGAAGDEWLAGYDVPGSSPRNTSASRRVRNTPTSLVLRLCMSRSAWYILPSPNAIVVGA